MRKVFFLSGLLFTLFSFSAKSQSAYDDGWVNGYSLARNMMFDLVNGHPEWGYFPTYEYNTIDPITRGVTNNVTYATYAGTNAANKFMSFSYNQDTYQAGIMASQTLTQNGSISYLEGRRTLSDYDSGVYFGFLAGRDSYFLEP